MKLSIIALITTLTFGLVGCDNSPAPTVAQKVEQQLESVHPLSDVERGLVTANAKAFFERKWPNDAGKQVEGQFIACRPSDSNANGLATCTGYIGDLKDGHLVEKKMYCGYRKELVGCSDQDTVSPK